jgi:hypothetical protein
MKKLSIIILIAILILPLPFSCGPTESNLPDYKITELELKVGKFDSGSFQKTTFTTESDTISSLEFVIQIAISKSESIKIAASSGLIPFTNVAFAKRIPPAIKSTIDLISIYSDESVYASNEVFPPDQSLRNLFEARNYYGDFLPVLNFIENFDRWQLEDKIYLQLANPLDQPLAQKLKVIVTMDDGTVFELETEKVVVK